MPVMIQNLRKFLNLQIRIGGRTGFGRVRPALRALQAYWDRAGDPRPEE